jgi:flagellum-specific peptidoglycan hydrolase FlgJ
VNQITPEIIAWAQQGVVPAALKIAAAMEESGLGEFIPAGSNNWFGIKSPTGVQAETKEQQAGGAWYTIKAGFMVFKTPADGFLYYDHLISTAAPYDKAWKTWLASPKTNADVETLTRNIAPAYATALSYAKALVSLEVEQKLFPYDVVATAAKPAPAPLSPEAAAQRLADAKVVLSTVKPATVHLSFLDEMEAVFKKYL